MKQLLAGCGVEEPGNVLPEDGPLCEGRLVHLQPDASKCRTCSDHGGAQGPGWKIQKKREVWDLLAIGAKRLDAGVGPG